MYAYSYLRVIRHALRPGGVWINLGPLLYHWSADAGVDGSADARYAASLELSWEELRAIAVAPAAGSSGSGSGSGSSGFGFGFDVLAESDVDCTYGGALDMMMWTNYRAKLFVARKIGE